MTGAVVHFEIRATNLDRAQTFYTSVFGWNIKALGDGYLFIGAGRAEYSGGQNIGIDGVIVLHKDGEPPKSQTPNAFVVNIEVEDIDATIAKIKQAGGSVVREKTPLEGVGHEAVCKDTEGNVFSVIHDDSLQKIVASQRH